MTTIIGRPLHRWNLKMVVVHRCSLAHFHPKQNPVPVPDNKLTGHVMRDLFKNPELGTGGMPPYHLGIFDRGRIEQMIALSTCGAHAHGYNWCSWGVVVIGNSDENEVPMKQYDALVRICRLLCAVNGGLLLRGHDELPGARRDPNKSCPGKYLPMDSLRREVGGVGVQIDGDALPSTLAWCEIEKAGWVV